MGAGAWATHMAWNLHTGGFMRSRRRRSTSTRKEITLRSRLAHHHDTSWYIIPSCNCVSCRRLRITRIHNDMTHVDVITRRSFRGFRFSRFYVTSISRHVRFSHDISRRSVNAQYHIRVAKTTTRYYARVASTTQIHDAKRRAFVLSSTLRICCRSWYHDELISTQCHAQRFYASISFVSSCCFTFVMSYVFAWLRYIIEWQLRYERLRSSCKYTSHRFIV